MKADSTTTTKTTETVPDRTDIPALSTGPTT